MTVPVSPFRDSPGVPGGAAILMRVPGLMFTSFQGMGSGSDIPGSGIGTGKLILGSGIGTGRAMLGRGMGTGRDWGS